MDAIDLFNHDNIELPRTWKHYDGQFNEYLKTQYENYFELLNQLSGSDFITQSILSRRGDIVKLAVALIKIIEDYFRGRVIEAYEALNKILREYEKDIKVLISNDLKDITYLYRVRLGDNFDFERKDLFHIPFELRQNVHTRRYSIPGLPCLYLGGSVFVCWEEMDRPDVNKLHGSAFGLVKNQKIKVLDFGHRPAHIAAMINDGSYKNQLNSKTPASDLIVSHAVCWSIICACSIASKAGNCPFKAEYILPQLLLQWIMNGTDIDGIRYFSTRIKGNYENFKFFLNYAFPVQSLKKLGYCDYLKAKFAVTRPLPWQLADNFNMGTGFTPNMHVKIEYTEGFTLGYINSKFEVFESCIGGQPFELL